LKMLIRWNHHGDFANIFRSFDNLLQHTAAPGEEPGLDSEATSQSPWLPRMAYPAVESFRRGEKYILRVELPGVDPKDIEMSVEDGRLTLKGEKRDEGREEDKDHYLREVGYGRFQRSFRLPRGVKAEELKARHENGVLTVTIPARSLADASRRVPIQISAESGSAREKDAANDVAKSA